MVETQDIRQDQQSKRRERYLRNRGRELEAARQRYADNAERICAQRRQRYAEMGEAARAAVRERVRRHRARRRAGRDDA